MKSFSACSCLLLLVFGAAFACVPTDPTSTVQVTSTLVVPGFKFGNAAVLDEYHSLMFVSVIEPSPGIARIDTRADMSVQAFVPFNALAYGPAVALGYSASRDRIYAVVSGGTASSVLQAFFLQIHPQTLLVENALPLNITDLDSPADVETAGREVLGHGPILFDEVKACHCSENAFFVFQYPNSRARYFHSVSVDLGNFTGGTIHTYFHYFGMSDWIFNVARIPGVFEAYITEGSASRNFPTIYSTVQRINLLDYSTVATVFSNANRTEEIQTRGCNFLDPYQGIADFGGFVVAVSTNNWIYPPLPVTSTCARMSWSAPNWESGLFVDYTPGGQSNTTRYEIHHFTSELPSGGRRGAGALLAERKPLLFAWASEETPAGYIYKALLSNETFSDDGSGDGEDPTSFALPANLAHSLALLIGAVSVVLLQ
eukprot:ANDGO_02194.mRNA.1 hypothetical protein